MRLVLRLFVLLAMVIAPQSATAGKDPTAFQLKITAESTISWPYLFWSLYSGKFSASGAISDSGSAVGNPDGLYFLLEGQNGSLTIAIFDDQFEMTGETGAYAGLFVTGLATSTLQTWPARPKGSMDATARRRLTIELDGNIP